MNKLFHKIARLLSQHDMLGLVVAVILGMGLIKLIETVVNYLIMPFWGLFTESGNWKLLTLSIGNLELQIGYIISELFTFLFILWIVSGFLTLKEPRRPDDPRQTRFLP